MKQNQKHIEMKTFRLQIILDHYNLRWLISGYRMPLLFIFITLRQL